MLRSVLRSFSFDRIKLDKFFVDEVEQDEQAVALLRSIVALGTTLHFPVLAERIERPGQLRIAAREGCSAIQGYLIGRPSRQLVDAQLVRSTMRNAVLGDAEVSLVAQRLEAEVEMAPVLIGKAGEKALAFSKSME